MGAEKQITIDYGTKTGFEIRIDDKVFYLFKALNDTDERIKKGHYGLSVINNDLKQKYIDTMLWTGDLDNILNAARAK